MDTYKPTWYTDKHNVYICECIKEYIYPLNTQPSYQSWDFVNLLILQVFTYTLSIGHLQTSLTDQATLVQV